MILKKNQISVVLVESKRDIMYALGVCRLIMTKLANTNFLFDRPLRAREAYRYLRLPAMPSLGFAENKLRRLIIYMPVFSHLANEALILTIILSLVMYVKD